LFEVHLPAFAAEAPVARKPAPRCQEDFGIGPTAGRLSAGSGDKPRFVNRTQSMPAQQFHELDQPALFVSAQMVMNVPAEVILAKVIIVFGPFADDVVERFKPEVLRVAESPAQRFILDSPPQCPDRVNERQTRQLHPGGSQVPNLMRGVGAQKTKHWTDEQHEKSRRRGARSG